MASADLIGAGLEVHCFAEELLRQDSLAGTVWRKHDERHAGAKMDGWLGVGLASMD